MRLTMNKLYWGFLGMLFFTVGGLALSFYIATPLFTPPSELTIVRFDWLGLPVAGIFAFNGMCCAGLAAYIHMFKHKNIVQRTTKFIMLPSLVGAIIGLGVNYANYFFVIKPNNMIECPLKIGYKKNLLRDYVFDTSLCKKR